MNNALFYTSMFKTRFFWKVVISLAIAHVLVSIGNDNWLDMMTRASYYFDMLLAGLSVYVVFEYVDRMTAWLDSRYPWMDGLLLRILLQVGLVVVVPAIFAILLTFIQWRFIYHQNMVELGYFSVEFPATILLILIVNLGFILYYYAREASKQEASATAAAAKGRPTVVLARKGKRNVPVSLSETAYLSLRNGVILVTTTDGTELMLAEPLDHYQSVLPDHEFFRVNRQTIIHRKACKSFKNIENGKIEVHLEPDSIPSVIVSQKRASDFRKWIQK